jgi:hypothetical protein
MRKLTNICPEQLGLKHKKHSPAHFSCFHMAHSPEFQEREQKKKKIIQASLLHIDDEEGFQWYLDWSRLENSLHWNQCQMENQTGLDDCREEQDRKLA